MPADRITLSIDADLGAAVRAAAEHRGTSVSQWLAEAAADRLRNELLDAALTDYETEHGAFTEAELADAAKTLGVRNTRRRRVA
jgi:uncharacterized protein (DUF1778 family)